MLLHVCDYHKSSWQTVPTHYCYGSDDLKTYGKSALHGIALQGDLLHEIPLVAEMNFVALLSERLWIYYSQTWQYKSPVCPQYFCKISCQSVDYFRTQLTIYPTALQKWRFIPFCYTFCVVFVSFFQCRFGPWKYSSLGTCRQWYLILDCFHIQWAAELLLKSLMKWFTYGTLYNQVRQSNTIFCDYFGSS